MAIDYSRWISGLSQAEQKAEVLQWIQATGQRYPNADFGDVVIDLYMQNLLTEMQSAETIPQDRIG
jgi:GH35 family endo-1,4-beta-xylanase